MERHCSTGQRPQWAVVPMEEEEYIYIYIYIFAKVSLQIAVLFSAAVSVLGLIS